MTTEAIDSVSVSGVYDAVRICPEHFLECRDGCPICGRKPVTISRADARTLLDADPEPPKLSKRHAPGVFK